MAALSKSSIMAIVKESTAGTLQEISANTDYIKLRAGFSITNENEIVESDEQLNDIGKSAPIVVGENPSASVPLYNRHSGVEGQAPEFGPLVESCLGLETENGTEYDVVSSTTSAITVDSGEGANFSEGQCLLIKDATNGYSMRNVAEVNGDVLTLSFEITAAATAGVELGKCVQYSPQSSGHPTFSMHRFQNSSDAAFKDAIAGARVTGLTFEYPTRNLATLTADMEGISYYFDHLVVDSSNEYIDFTDSSSTLAVTLTNKVFKTPIDLANDIATKMSAASVDVISCSYSSSTGKFTISSDGSTLSLLSNTGSNVANSIWTDIGVSVAADQTGALTYTGSLAMDFDPKTYASPSYDITDPIPVVNSQLLIGDAADYSCRKVSTASLKIDSPKSNVLSACAENGVSETLTLERGATFEATLVLEQYEVELFHKSYNNTTTSICFNIGSKDSSGNWIPGKCHNMYMQSAKITTVPIADQDGYQVISLSAMGFVTSSTKDIFINYV